MKSPLILCLALAVSSVLRAADPQESDFYKITTFSPPQTTAMEVGSIELLPGGKLALGTRRGEIWTVTDADGDPEKTKFQLFASGAGKDS